MQNVHPCIKDVMIVSLPDESTCDTLSQMGLFHFAGNVHCGDIS